MLQPFREVSEWKSLTNSYNINELIFFAFKLQSIKGNLKLDFSKIKFVLKMKLYNIIGVWKDERPHPQNWNKLSKKCVIFDEEQSKISEKFAKSNAQIEGNSIRHTRSARRSTSRQEKL